MMVSKAPPEDEARRLAALREYCVLDTLPDEGLDELTALAATICESPIALISLMDERRHWFKSKVGMEVNETPREIAFCTHALHSPGLFTVPDATLDDRFAGNPLVTGEPGIRFYAGAPLLTPNNEMLGTLCVMDRVPRTLTQAQAQALLVLSRQVMAQLELLRLHFREREQAAIVARRLAAIVESSDDAIIGKDLNGIITSWNQGAEKMFGYAGTEMVGNSITRFIPGDRQGEEEQILGKVRRGEKVEHFVTVRQTKDGRRIHVSVTASPIKDAGGKVIGVSKVARDITSQIRNEEELRAGEERLRLVTENARVGLVMVNRERRYTFANGAYGEILGLPSPDIVGRRVSEVLAPIYEEQIRPRLDRAFAGERVCYELRKPSPGGERWYTVKYEPTKVGGQVALVVVVITDFTEQKRAGDALREREEQLRLYAEHSPVAVAMLDRDMKYVVVSRRWREDFRLGEQALVGRSHYEIFPEVPLRWVEIHRRCLAGATEKCDMEAFPRADGTIDWIRWEIRPWHQADGSIGGIIIFSEDITARKVAEEALRESEARFAKAFHANPAAMCVTTLKEGRFIEVNERYCQLFGFTREELIGRTSLGLALWADPADRAAAVEQLRAHGFTHDFEARFRRKNGDMVEALIFMELIEFPGESEPVAISMFTDITERKRAEAALQVSELRYRTLFERAPDGILIGDAESTYLDANETMCRMLGYTHGELVGLTASDIIAPAETDAIEPVIREIRAGSAHHREWQFRRKDGSTFPVEVIAVMMPDGNLLGMVRDITERKQLEKQFLRAQRMESIGTLASGVAHDLNNILAPITMSAPCLRMEIDEGQRESIISTIEKSAERGAQIVKQVLAFGRGLEGEKQPLKLGVLIREMAGILRATFPKNITIENTAGPGLWTVLGDVTQIHQVLLNLCVNARDAMPDGGMLRTGAGNLDVDGSYSSMLPEARLGPYVMIEVCDTGSGIPPEIQERIFEPFFTTKGVGKGTGLGLSTVHAIVKSHGGFIKVASEVGKGTTFQVWLPATREHAAARQDAALTPVPAGRGELVLVVDDEASVVSSARTVLEPNGYRVLEAADGTEAMAVFAQHADGIALVITDIMMPHMSGVMFIRALRKMKPGVPVIASTGLGKKSQLAELKEMGIEVVLKKPYNADTLMRAVHGVLHP